MTPETSDGRQACCGTYRSSRRPPVTFQTVRLTRGKHRSPKHGACVMELASMLAGEAFSDQPATVCPVIGSFLRSYNDAVDDDQRQDLYEYASRVVGSHSLLDQVQLARADRLLTWASELPRSRWSRLRRLLPLGRRAVAVKRPADAGAFAVRAIRRHTDQTHAQALTLIDDLLAIGAAAGARSDLACGCSPPSLSGEPERSPVG